MKFNEHFQGLKVNALEDANVIITGIPFDKNTSIGSGAAFAPDHIREMSIMFPPMTQFGYMLDKIKLFDNGNITTEDFEKMQEEAYKAISSNKFPVFLGGDHSVAIATERAFYDYAKSLGKIPTIIHIDAHPDICDVYEDNYYSHATPNKRSLDYGYEDQNLTMIGMRCFEPQEVKFLNMHSDIDCFTAHDVRRLGVSKLIELLKLKYNDNNLIYLSYDIDANDPAYAPGTGTPEPWGLTSFETLDLITGIVSEFNIGCFDIVEVSPKLDVNDITSSLAIKTLYEVLGIVQKRRFIK